MYLINVQVIEQANHPVSAYIVEEDIMNLTTLEGFHVVYFFDFAMDMVCVNHVYNLLLESTSVKFVFTSAKGGKAAILEDSDNFEQLTSFTGKMATSSEFKTIYVLRRLLTEGTEEPTTSVDPLLQRWLKHDCRRTIFSAP